MNCSLLEITSAVGSGNKCQTHSSPLGSSACAGNYADAELAYWECRECC